MDEGELVPARRLGLDGVLRLDHARLEQASVNQRILASGKDVRPDIDAIPGRVDDLQIPGGGNLADGPRRASSAGRTSEATG